MKTFAILITLILIPFSKGWADFSVIKTEDTMSQIEENKKSEIIENVSQKNKSRAPEPSNLILFGSGLLGLVTSFIRRTYAAAKRSVDVLGSIAAIILLSPLFLLAALLIKITSKGPIIFKQIRLGKKGQVFEIYKFRTMKIDAEKDSGPVWASQNDHRLIPVGNFLRKTHIDEIPQFINVLKGEMSIVGPRPERPFFVEKLKTEITDYEKRLMIKPGITGLAQVCHRADETTRDVKIKVKYDLLYIKKMSLYADIQILYRTLRLVVVGGVSSLANLKIG